jgi:hypothetical protein
MGHGSSGHGTIRHVVGSYKICGLEFVDSSPILGVDFREFLVLLGGDPPKLPPN